MDTSGSIYTFLSYQFISSYLAAILSAIFISQGAYWLIKIPMYLKALRRVELRLNTLDPAESPQLNELARLVKWSVFFASVALAAVLTLFLFLRSYPSSFLLLTLIYFIPLLILFNLLIRSNLELSRIIRSEKNRIMDIIQEKIATIFDYSSHNQENVELINDLWHIYNNVKSTKNSAFNISFFRYLSGSILVQVFPVLLKNIPDLLGKGNNFVKVLKGLFSF
jgi:hypothetical protein